MADRILPEADRALLQRLRRGDQRETIFDRRLRGLGKRIAALASQIATVESDIATVESDINTLVGAGWQIFSPTFDSGVTLGDGGFGVCRYRVYEGGGGEQMDIQGSFTLGSTSAITGSVIMQVPGGYKGPPTPGPTSQQGTGMLYNDSSTLGPWHGAWGLAANSIQIVFRRLDGASFAALSATSPFTWANGDSIRWDIHGLYVVPV